MRNEQSGTAVTILVLGLMIAFMLSLIGYVFYAWGETSYAQKIINEKLSMRSHEDADVMRGRDEYENMLVMTNKGGNVIITEGVLYEIDGGVEIDELFEVFGTLENKYIPVDVEKLNTAENIGIYTNLGNIFWVEEW